MSYWNNCPDWLPFIELRCYLKTVNVNKQKVLHNHYPEIQLNKYDHKIFEKVGKFQTNIIYYFWSYLIELYFIFAIVYQVFSKKNQNIKKYWKKSGNLVSLEKWELDNRQWLVNFYSLAQMGW